MKIHFRDVQTGMVEARAVIEIEDGVFLNEITILNIDGQISIEFPRKNFKGKNDKTHYLDIITFGNEDKRVLWELQIKDLYRTWRKENRKVLIYEDEPVFPSDARQAEKRKFPRKDFSPRRPESGFSRTREQRASDKPYFKSDPRDSSKIERKRTFDKPFPKKINHKKNK